MEMMTIGVVLLTWGLFYTRMVDLKMPSIEPDLPINSETFGYENPQFLNESDSEDEH
jgi:hypothetical protein